ncbi:IS1595 family transposase, partial [Neisseria dentiae]|uniref:IS1595 family transposase n=1 Tax=Neisseria dentiae TaxID=194197 RepID=UPI00211C5479|nr:IS1595 family transposase [Neisseria dentiae]
MTEPKFRQILRLFSLDLTASDTAKLTGISVRSINSLYLKLRRRLAGECERQTPFCGIVELDESYFGAKRIRGKRGRGADGKTIVFGILKRGDRVYTEIVSDASKAALQKVIRGHISVEGVINTDGWRGYQGLVDMGFAKHFRVRHGDNEFVRGTRHING